MCGIAGYLGPKSPQLSSLGDRLAASLAHRGPDDEGREVLPVGGQPDRCLLLVHRRLAIIDLSPLGHEPMVDADTGNWIVYNGEIYNFKALRETLRLQGATFRSQSDAEVLLKGYGRGDTKVLDDVTGMFAFAIWDAARNRLLLAVDPLGIKPLYYWCGPRGEFMFASEIDALLETGLVPARIEPSGLESYLSYGAVQAPATIVAGVRALLPGTYMAVSGAGEVSGPHQYWTAPFAPDGEALPATPRLEHDLRDLLGTVVRDHLVSDVPVGAFLSGGIDSSTIAILASDAARDFRTFSVTFAEEEFSEAPFSREVARRYGLNHTEVCLSERELLQTLPSALDAVDQPTVDGTNTYVISRAVRAAGVTVVLSGQGGDEVFGGYPTFRRVPKAWAWRRRLRYLPPAAARVASGCWRAIRDRRRVLPDKIGQILGSDGSPYTTFFLLRQLFPPSSRRALFPSGGAGTSPEGLPAGEAERLRSATASLDPVNLVSALEQRTYLANMLLRDGDVMSMAHGLEVRVPFLDRRVVEFAARLPGDVKMDRVLPKPLLLRAMGDRIPAAVYRRPKQGFTFPWPHWLRGELRPLAETALSDAQTFHGLGVDGETVRGFWRAFLDGRPGISWSRIWALIVLREWAVRRRALI